MPKPIRFFCLVLCLFLTPSLLSAQDAAALYRTHCASCHDASSQTRAPARDSLRQLTPERILDALESITGVMSSQGLARTPSERRALALFLSGKPFGSEKPFDMDRFGCKQAQSFADPLSRPNWNGWSNSISNSRFQDGAAARLDPARVSQLKLKWAFAYPGDIMAYSQPTVVGGRVFVGSAGHKIYSLDAMTGCAHWVFVADSGVRSAITIGQVSNSTTYAAYFGDLAGNV